MAWDDGLQGTALDIARAPDVLLRVMAGPGTGKSFCMKRRVARLLEVDQVQPDRVLAVTFTRNAAASLYDDLHALDIEGCEDIRASTLHAFCFRLLGRADVFAYLGRVPRPLVTITQSGVLKFEAAPLMADLNGLGFGAGRECTKRVRAFEAAWARLQSEQPGWPQDEDDRRFHAALVSWLQFHEAMLIGELIPLAFRFVRNNPAHPVLHGYDHVIVDEYQDLNRAEQILLDRLARNCALAIVGDVDQSIYSFRYAHPEGIVQFAQEHPNTHDENLVECRRCPIWVVELADHLIRHNHPADGPNRLHPLHGNPHGDVVIVQWPTLADELSGLASYVQFLVAERGVDPGDIVVLTPRRLFGYGIRDEIKQLGIDAHSFYNEEPLETDEAQEAFVLLTLLSNPLDKVALRWWLGFGSPSWRRGQYQKLRNHCHESGTNPHDALTALVNGDLGLPGVSELQMRFEELQARLEPLRAQNCEGLLADLFPAGQDWAKPMRELSENILPGLLAQEGHGPLALLEQLKTNITQPETPERGEFVRVMSLHKSKGLTSKVVLVAGCVEGLIPTLDPDLRGAEFVAALNEQRRLFYVAITRCTEILVLSALARLDTTIAYKIGARLRAPRRRQGVWPTITSRFIDELGPSAPEPVAGAHWLDHLE